MLREKINKGGPALIPGDKKGKIWGETTLVFQSINVEVHYLDIKKGGYCSIHRHKKSNLFYVISGQLKVTIWDRDNKDKVIDCTVLGEGQLTSVYPGYWHKFEALKDTWCIEVYQAIIEEGDIERFTEGGLDT